MRTLTVIAAGLAALVLVLVLDPQLTVPRSAVEELPPPETGAVILEHPLNRAGPAGLFTCRRSDSGVGFIGEGLLMKVDGRCIRGDSSANLVSKIDGLTVPDGEVRVELKVSRGVDRAQFAISLRRPLPRTSQQDGIYGGLELGSGRARILKVVTRTSTVLAERADLAGWLAADDWNSLAIRAQWPRFWLLVNDQPILSAADETFDFGEVALHSAKSGDPDDGAEVRVVVRNLRVSALAAGDPARVPTYERP